MSVTILQPGQPTPQNCQPGDFLLVHGTAPLSRLIQFGQHAKHNAEAAQWTHAACLDGRWLVEAEASGVKAAPVAKYNDKKRALVQLDTTRHKRAAASAYIEKAKGLEYGFLDFISVAASQLFGFQLIVTTSDAVICSQLVAEMLERCGIFLDGAPALTTPADLFAAFTK